MRLGRPHLRIAQSQITGFRKADDLRDRLWSMLNHYKAVLNEHGMSLPFHQPTDR
jgi:hypothetical protein